MKKYLFPKRVLQNGQAAEYPNLLKKKELQIGLAETDTVEFEDGDHAIFDFGAELCGGVRILTYMGANVPVRIRFGESLTECCAEIGGEMNATNDHSLRDMTVMLQRYSDMTFGQTGFRFVRLDFMGKVELKCVVAESHCLQKKAKYVYGGKDATIQKIYETAKHTVDLCASSGYVWDGVKRDRLVWIGDMHPEMLALTTLYGRMPEIERSLDFVKKQSPLPEWMNAFPTYSMWWIIILADYYQRTGAKSFTEKQLDYLEGLIAQMDEHVKENGELNYPFYFVDWPTREKPDELAGVRAINIMAMNKAIELLQSFGRSTAYAEKLLNKLLKISIEAETSKQVLGLKYCALGELSESDRKKLVAGGAKGMSTFMSYYVLKAVASFDKKAAIAMMKEYYGAMLEKGATTFWEDFDLEWTKNSCRIDEFPTAGQKDIHGGFGAYCYIGFRHSLCHGWSAGVLTFMEEECK